MLEENKKHEELEHDEMTMEELYAASFKDLRPGSVVDGVIVKIMGNEVLVDIGYKAEGIVSLNEFHNSDELKEGDSVRVLLESTDDQEGLVKLSKIKADYIEAWGILEDKYHKDMVISGTIKKRVKGGFIVNIGVPAFLPASQLDVKLVKDLDAYVGEKIDVKILKMNKKRRNIVVSRRVILEESYKKMKEEMDNKIHAGAILPGRVKNITNFGAFIDLGGIDGLLHMNDITWKKISHPTDVLAVGQDVNVKVLDYDEKNNRISLSLKELEKNPWDILEEKFKDGDVVEGTVVSIVEYGAFVEIVPGVEGLVHISEMSWDKNLKTPAQILNEGDKIEVMILKMDVENHKVSLGIKQVDGDPWEKIRDDFSEGDVVEGEIKNITDFGAFVEIVPGVEGLLHVSDISWERVDKPQDVLNVGDTIKVMILKINEDERKVALGIKQTLPNPWDEMMSDYKVGDVVTVTVSKITKNNAICKMENGIEGFLAISQLDTKHVEKVDDVVNVGDEIEVKIIKIQKNERKIDFSIKALKQDTEKQILDEIKGEAGNHDKVSLKDVIEQEMVDNIAGETEKKTKAAPKKKAAKKKSEDETPAETPEEAEEDGGEEKKED